MTGKHTIIAFLLSIPWSVMAQRPPQALLDRAVDYYNYMMVRFILGYKTGGLNRFQTAFDQSGKNIPDTSYSRTRAAIPKEKKEVIALCDEIETMKEHYPTDRGLSGMAVYIAGYANYQKSDTHSSGYMYPLLYRYYKQFSNTTSFRTHQQNMQDQLSKMAQAYPADNDQTDKKIFPGTQKNRTMIDYITEHAGGFVLLIFGLLWYVSASVKSSTQVKLNTLKKELTEHQVTLTDVRSIRDLGISAATEILNLQTISQTQEKRLQEVEEMSHGGIWAAYLELKDELQKINARLQQAEAAVRKSGSLPSTTLSQKSAMPADGLKRIFFPLPDQKTGQFRAVLGKDSISAYSIYQFNLAPEGDRASFQLLASPEVEAMVLNFPQSYLRFTYDTEGVPGINKKIEPIKPGEAVLEDKYWVIQKKGVIRYV